MENVHFNIREGLSQKNRQFKELVDGFYAVEDSSLKDLLLAIKDVCAEKGFPEILEGIDVDDLVKKVDGEADGNLEPSASIYATCASLLLRVKKRINTLPDKRIDFYYEKILGEKAIGIQGDSAHVIFPNLAEGVSCDLPCGTSFLAGADEDGNDIIFKSVKDSNINDASVKKILTLAVNDDSVATYTEIPAYSPKLALNGEEMIPYPLFGLTRSGRHFANFHNARLGYAYTSPVLFLKEGRREITMTFTFEPSSVKGTLLEQGKNPEEFLKTFSNAFRIFLTTEDGWYGVEGYQLDSRVLNPKCAENCFSLSFILLDEVPSIVAYNPEVHEDSFSSKYPIAKIEINPQTSYNPWKTLRSLKLLKIMTEVHVHGLRSFDAANDIGTLSLSTTVQPFGPVPTVGNTFSIACDEFLGKKLTALDLYGEWRGVPKKSDFSEWYKLYPKVPRTKDFKVSVFSVNNVLENSASNQKFVLSNLFSTEESQISKAFHISFKDVLGINNSKTLYKIRLYSPENAFMHQDYSRAICSTLMEQALKKVFSSAVPNQPYTPELENLYVDYKAKCETRTRRISSSEDSGEIFFLHPWGFSSRNTMDENGCSLFIGITYTELPKSINLYFHLKRDSEYVVSDDIGEFAWSVLYGENWVTLPFENILYNTTAGFTTSGIVSLVLPKDVYRGGTMMPGNLIWLRLRPLKSWRHCSRIYSVYAQALEVKRCVSENSHKEIEHVKSGTITELAKSVNGLSEVCQITESFGGKTLENKAKMRTRIAERLYHRGRALSARDYERLILEEFPEVHMVKCFPSLKPEGTGELVPGYVTIVPVSKLIETNGYSWDPCLGGKVLNEIKLFLEKRVPASAIVRVMNPFFEKLQVRCNVDFEENSHEGESMLKLNDDINQFLSPWSDLGQMKFFGWTLKEDDLKNYILKKTYVKAIKDFSILRVVSNDSCNFLVDDTEQSKTDVMRGICPWSVPTPMPKHFLNIVSEIDQSRRISVGYGDLEIGSTFIVRRRGDATK